jgi:hypothetical protein
MIGLLCLLAIFGAFECPPYNPAGSVSTGPGAPTVAMDHSYTHGYYGGDYWDQVTFVGHITEDGQQRLLDSSYVENQGQQFCLPQIETDWHFFGEALSSPETTYGQGGYATGFSRLLVGPGGLLGSFHGLGQWRSCR